MSPASERRNRKSPAISGAALRRRSSTMTCRYQDPSHHWPIFRRAYILDVYMYRPIGESTKNNISFELLHLSLSPSLYTSLLANKLQKKYILFKLEQTNS